MGEDSDSDIEIPRHNGSIADVVNALKLIDAEKVGNQIKGNRTIIM